MLGGTSPALKKTMLDLVTNYGAVSDSQANSRARNGGSFPMKDLKHYRGHKSSQASNAGKKFVHFAGGGSSSNAIIRRSEAECDSNSQEGIIRHDEIEISYENARKGSRANEKWT